MQVARGSVPVLGRASICGTGFERYGVGSAKHTLTARTTLYSTRKRDVSFSFGETSLSPETSILDRPPERHTRAHLGFCPSENSEFLSFLFGNCDSFHVTTQIRAGPMSSQSRDFLKKIHERDVWMIRSDDNLGGS